MRSWTWACAAMLLTAGAARPQVVVNEVMPAPGTDWTQNGIFSSQEDEWIELFNAGTSAVDVSGWLVGDGAGGSATPRLGLSGTVQPGEHVFLTGEHAVDWESQNGFPAVGLSLNNSSDVLYLFQTAGGTTTLVDSVAWTGSATNVSFGPLPDGTGPLTDFDALTPGGQGAQPTPGGPNGGPAGPKILSLSVVPSFPTSADTVTVQAVAADADGIAQALLFVSVDGGGPSQQVMGLASGTATYGTWEAALGPFAGGTVLTVSVRVSDGTLIEQTNDLDVLVAGTGSAVALNEILADPPADLAGDANGDGVRDTADDEFVEIVNRSAAPVDLTDWSIHDATGLRHLFASGPLLQPGELFVVFGGGTPTGIPSGSDVASTGGLSLNNTGDQVLLVGPDAVPRDVHAYGSEANADQSLIRVPDGNGAWTRPGDEGFGWSFSPGLPNTVVTSVTERSWAEVKALYR